MAKVVLMLVLVVVLVAIGAYLLGYWRADRRGVVFDTPVIDQQRVRETGSDIAQGARAAGSRMAEAVEDGALTAKSSPRSRSTIT
jgi:hypothetical protein